MRTTRAHLTATFEFAIGRAQAAGLDTTGWQFDFGKPAYGYRYEITAPDGMRIDLGASAGQAHLTLAAIAAAWHAVATRTDAS